MNHRTRPHTEDIKATIRIGFGSLGAFEQAHGLPDGSTSDVLRGRSVRRTAEAIAALMGMPVTALFPGRYGDKPDDTSGFPDAHRLNKTAA